jgi:ADP-ribose pyrophosphatase
MKRSPFEKPLDVEVLCEGRHLRLVRRNGWEFAERRGISGVAVIAAVTPDRQIVFVEQYREPVQRRVIELPAGLAGDEAGYENEPLQDAAGRELTEETGYTADHIERVFFGPPSAGVSNEVLTFFFARGLKKSGPGGGVVGEDITVHTVPLGSAAEWLQERQEAGCLIDPKVYCGLFIAEQRCNSFPSPRQR